ncbi:hypothetical protein D3C74_252090 [compost metagenome]
MNLSACMAVKSYRHCGFSTRIMRYGSKAKPIRSGCSVRKRTGWAPSGAECLYWICQPTLPVRRCRVRQGIRSNSDWSVKLANA